MTLLPYTLAAALADGRFHTGDALGRQFGVTRAAIWKALRKCDELGLELHSVRGKGYRLDEPLFLLDATQIRAVLSPTNQERLAGLELLPTVDSTNAHVLRQWQAGALTLAPGQSHVCLAERQSAGRGRRGRDWVSPFGHNLYLSLLQRFDSGAASLDGLSLAVGVALVRALREWRIPRLALKWPNDLLCDEAKLAGILIEISGDVTGQCQLVIGIGLNVKQNTVKMRGVEQPWTTLVAQGFRSEQRNRLFGRILEHQLEALATFQREGFAAFAADWNALDVSAGREVWLLSGTEAIAGVGRGVDDGGALLLDTIEGRRRVVGGELSLRLAAAPCF